MLGMPEEIIFSKVSGSFEFNSWHYQYFFEINFKFQPKVCDGYHDLNGLQMPRVGSYYTGYAVIRIYIVLKKQEVYYTYVFFKKM